MSLRRLYHRHVRHHHRFNIAVVLTMIAVAWIVVPAVARFVDTIGSYDPRVYEPKDIQRSEWIASHPSLFLGTLTWPTVLKLVLFVFAALAWLAVSSSPGGGRSGAPRPGASPRSGASRR